MLCFAQHVHFPILLADILFWGPVVFLTQADNVKEE